MEVGALAWALTIAVVAGLLAGDAALGSLRPHVIGFREAAAWSAFYIAVAIAFGLVVARQSGWEYGGQYFAGYLVERSLSVDNLFVFVVILTTFATPPEHQQKAVAIGIILALVLRAVFIVLGATLVSLFSFMFLLFGLLLIWTAFQLYRHRNEDPDIESNVLLRGARRVLPVGDEYAGGRLIARIRGRLVVTPLFMALVAIGGADMLFALDSIPAVFGVTKEPYLVFTANAFALLGLRPLFFLVRGLLDRLVYLSIGLALILGFIGVKLVLHWGHGLDDRVPVIATPLSLGVIAAILMVTTVASLIRSRRDPSVRAHAGGVTGARLKERTPPPRSFS